MRRRLLHILPASALLTALLCAVSASGVRQATAPELSSEAEAASMEVNDSLRIPSDSVSPAPVADLRATVLPADSVAMDSLATPLPAALPSLPKPKTTPVDIDRAQPEQPIMHYYDKHGEPLQTPVRFLAELDTITKVTSGPKYPAFDGVTISANFFDAIMMIIGQQRANFDLAATCSVHNWFFPTVEAGVGFSNAHPDDGRCYFKVSPTPYVKVGMNYNFLYKSNPDYQVFLGLRAGWSTFTYNVYDIKAGSEYYVADGPTERTGLRSTAFFGQALAGVQVKIWKFISMGWTVRYNFNFKQTYSQPDFPAWFTPGYGTSTPITATFSLGFTIGRKSSKAKLTDLDLPEVSPD